MKDNNDHKLSDDELNAFLEGRDAVSAAYRQLDRESPPPELDARILARARDSVNHKSPGRNDVFIRPYATAATVFVCLGITFMLVNEPDLPTPTDRREATIRLERTIPVTSPQADSVAQEAESAEDTFAFSDDQAEAAAPAPADAGAGNEADRRTPPPANTQNLSNLLDQVQQRRIGEAAEAPAAEQRERQEIINATADTAARAPALNANRVQAQDADNANAGGAAAANVVAETLEEIAVTGSRIREEMAYRNDREAWLREIARLRETGETDAAGVEANLFLERYPDADLDAELAALETP